MKKVHFEQQDSLRNQLLAFPMTIAIGLYAYTTLVGEDSSLRVASAVIGFGLLIFQLGKPFAFKNYVGWNRRGINIKLNTFWFKTYSFKDLEAFHISEDTLELARKNRTVTAFSLTDILSDDIGRIQDILVGHGVPFKALERQSV